jgi:hypothetical protein
MTRRSSFLARHGKTLLTCLSIAGGIFAFGWRARIELVEARASQASPSADPVIVKKLDAIAADVSAMKTDVALLKCSAKFPGVCPESK